MDGPWRGRRESLLLPSVFQLRSSNQDTASTQANFWCLCKWEQRLLNRLWGFPRSTIRTIKFLIWHAGCGACTHLSAHAWAATLLWQITHHWVPYPLELIMGAGKVCPRESPSKQIGKNLYKSWRNGRDLCTNFVPSASPKQIRTLAPCLQESFALLFQSSFELVSIVEFFEEGSKTLPFITENIKLYIKLFSAKNQLSMVFSFSPQYSTFLSMVSCFIFFTLL